MKILLVLPLLLLTITAYEVAYMSTRYSDTSRDDLECVKKEGIKKVFVRREMGFFDGLSKLLAELKPAMPVLSDAQIFIQGSEYSPSALMSNFTSNVPSSLYQTVWLCPSSQAKNIDCGILKAYVSYCQNKGISCGFQFSDSDWSRIFGDNRSACPEIASLPLYYVGSPSSWRPMGGWSTYRYNEVYTKLTFCRSYRYDLYAVEAHNNQIIQQSQE